MNEKELYLRHASFKNPSLNAKVNSQLGRISNLEFKLIAKSQGLITKLRIQQIDPEKKERKFVFGS